MKQICAACGQDGAFHREGQLSGKDEGGTVGAPPTTTTTPLSETLLVRGNRPRPPLEGNSRTKCARDVFPRRLLAFFKPNNSVHPWTLVSGIAPRLAQGNDI